MQQTEDPIIIELFQKRRNVIKTGLERVQAAYATLGKPAYDIPCLLIGGTNGKGTTSGFLCNLLIQAGLRVGLYTSPHILSFSERIQVSDDTVTNEELIADLEFIKAGLSKDQYDSLSFFEITTLMSFLCFARRRPDVLLIEVGMGGRWDATNVLDPMASIIVSIGLDHQEFLGPSLEDIAFEKSGIMRAGRPCFFGGSLESAAGQVLADEAKKRTTTILPLDTSIRTIAHELILSLPQEADTFLPLSQPIQRLPHYLQSNFYLALMAACWSLAKLKSAGTKSFAEILANHEPLPEQRWPPHMWGRYQHLQLPQLARPLLVDACHNIDGAAAFIRTLQRDYGENAKLPALVSILSDKNIPEIFDIFSKNLEPIYIYKQASSRSLQSEHIAPRHKHLPIFESFSEAFGQMKKVLAEEKSDKPLVVCGSIHGLGEAFQYLDIKMTNTCH